MTPVSKTRIRWLDCAKAVAILAVVVDHCGTLYDDALLRLPEGYSGRVGLLYDSPRITLLCWFSVSLFILLSGVSAWISSAEGTRVAYGRQLKRMGRLLGAYAAATLAVELIRTGSFRLPEYLERLLHFDALGLFYYVFVLLQLMLAAPLLLRWCRFCRGRRHGALWQVGTLALLLGVSLLSIRFTRTLPLFGGGKFLFGGTYLVLYALGMVLASQGAFQGSAKSRGWVLALSGAGLVGWLALLLRGALPFDGWLAALVPEILTQPTALSNVLGNGTVLSNPPGLLMMLYAVLLLLFLYAGFSLLEEKGGKVGKGAAGGFGWLGRYTLSIYLYHFLIRDCLLNVLPWETMGIWARRAVFLPCMLLVPAVAAMGLGRLYRALKGCKNGKLDQALPGNPPT